jgi:hypothetical protein
MSRTRKLLIAAALLSWPWIASAPQADAMPPAGAPAGIGFRGASERAPGLLRFVGDHDRGPDHYHRSHYHHYHHHHYRRPEERHERDEHEH